MDYQVKITHNPAGRGCVYFEIPVVEHNPRFRLVFLPVLLSLVNNRVTGRCLQTFLQKSEPELGEPKAPIRQSAGCKIKSYARHFSR